MFPLKVNKEVYYAGMNEFEERYVLVTNDNKIIAKDDYLKLDIVDELNKYVESLKEEIIKLRKIKTCIQKCIGS